MVFTGTKGRMELEVSEAVYVNGQGHTSAEGATNGMKLIVYPMFDNAYEVEIPKTEGGHGGGDPVLLNDIFGIPEPDPLNRAASHIDGVTSIMTGICANKSIASGLPVKVADVLGRRIRDLK